MAKQAKLRSVATPQRKKRPPGLQISVGWQYNGGVYRLDPWHTREIRAAFPEARVIEDGLLLGYNETRDYELYHKPFYEQIAQMVTGLTPEQIGQMGGVRFYYPEADEIIWEWHPQKPNA